MPDIVYPQSEMNLFREEATHTRNLHIARLLLGVFVLVTSVVVWKVDHTNTTVTHVKVGRFTSQNKSLQNYISNEDNGGTINIVTTSLGDQLLLTEQADNMYSVGQLVHDDKGYGAERLSDWIKLNQGAMGVGWEFNSLNGHPYTILIRNLSDKAGFIQIPNSPYMISVVAGHTLSNGNIVGTNLIKGIKSYQ